MENKGHPRVKKSTEQLKVSIDGEVLKRASKFLKRRHQNLLEVTATNAEISILKNLNSYQFKLQNDGHNSLLSSSFELASSPVNVYSTLQLLAEIKSHKSSMTKEAQTGNHPRHNKKAYLKAQKKFEQVIKKSRYLKEKMGPLLDITADDQAIDQLFDESHSIETVLFHILKLTGFTTYQTCQLIIHEKGKAEAESVHIDESNSIIHSQLSAKKFNTLYRLIKKSKNKHFNQTQILDKDLHIVGPFLAKEIETKEHDLLFIISRNGFLAPSQQEQEYFFSIIPSLKQVFRFILTKSKLTEREQLLAQSFNFYPFPILLTVGGNIIFKNRFVQDEHLESVDSQAENISFNEFDLGVDKKLYVFPPSEADLISDFNHHQRISLLGELLNTLKHELSNPLFGLRLTAEMLESEVQDKETRDSLKDIAQNAKRCQSIIDNFSNLYVVQEDLKKVDLNFLVREIMTLTKSETRGIPLKYEGPGPNEKSIRTHATWLTQIVFNLIVNASQAIKSTGRELKEFEITVQVKTHRDTVSIYICDTGPGVPSELEEEILKPYFTTKAKGTGLGLSICTNLAQRLHGHLEYRNNTPSPGATFSIHLPINE